MLRIRIILISNVRILTFKIKWIRVRQNRADPNETAATYYTICASREGYTNTNVDSGSAKGLRRKRRVFSISEIRLQ